MRTGRSNLSEVFLVQQNKQRHLDPNGKQPAQFAPLRDQRGGCLLHRLSHGRILTQLQPVLHQQVQVDSRKRLPRKSISVNNQGA